LQYERLELILPWYLLPPAGKQMSYIDQKDVIVKAIRSTQKAAEAIQAKLPCLII
jgi:hypothetical protein